MLIVFTSHDFFQLHDPERQISAFVEDSVRSFLPTMDLDKAFESKEEMAHQIMDSVVKSMAPYGVFVLSVWSWRWRLTLPFSLL